ncbi:MAG: MFS transporter [Candidatus Asgardarchaeia archaeon]
MSSVNNYSKEELKRLAYIGILSFGLVSLFGDIIYEGARGIVPTYLEYLGASALIVGIATGLGEFVGYSLRLLSGYVADVKKSYWPFAIMGYALLIVIPLLAFAGHWIIAIVLILIERTAKALRSPSRDTLLSVITKGVGTGKAFGYHELMDQIGATVGPAIIAAVLYYYNNSFFYAFLIMLVPYFFMVSILAYVYAKLHKKTEDLFNQIDLQDKRKPQKLTKEFKLYTLAVFLNTAGLVHMSIILYSASLITFPYMVALLYLVLQGVDAFAAPISGHLYDAYGKNVLIVPFVLSVIPTIFTFLGGFYNIVLAIVFFGFILGMQESIYRAAISDMTSVKKRGTAYGIFNTAYGGGFLVSGAIFGYFFDLNLGLIAMAYGVITQILALSFLLKIKPHVETS